MLTKKRFALNRIISPALGLREFVKFTRDMGLAHIELRNDLGGKSTVPDIVDGLNPVEVLKLLQGEGITVITINALQKFNLASKRAACLDELKQLLELAAAIDCKAIVLCPNNDKGDTRSPARKYQETVEALSAYGPLFVNYNIAAYVEALGFGISSLASLPVIVNAIRASGFGCYRVLLDTFHHYIGPDDGSIFGMGGFGASYELPYTGLIHISGVEDAIPPQQFLDEHRILIGPKDTMHNKEIIYRLDALGYQGLFSFEPFSQAVQKLSPDELSKTLEASFQYLGV